ncbi:MAG: DinB family protein [Ginsengibacter sp.]
MNNPLYYLSIIFKLNTRLFTNTLAGVTEDQGDERISDHNNSIRWIATHTVWARYNILTFLGKQITNPYNGLFENFKPFDPSDTYPSMAAIKSEWEKASALLEEAIAGITEEGVSNTGFKNPTGDSTVGGTIAFLAQHESYDIGQLGLLKKYFTSEAMSYS